MKETALKTLMMGLLISVSWFSFAITPEEIADQKVEFAYTVQAFVSEYATQWQEWLAPVYPALQALQQLVYVTPLELSGWVRARVQTYIRLPQTRLEMLLEYLIRINEIRQRVVYDEQRSEQQKIQVSEFLDWIEWFVLAEIEDRLLTLSPVEAARVAAYYSSRDDVAGESGSIAMSWSATVSGGGTITPES